MKGIENGKRYFGIYPISKKLGNRIYRDDVEQVLRKYDDEIKTAFAIWLCNQQKEIEALQSTIAKISKKSAAHKAAIEVFRDKRKPDIIIKADDVIEFLY